MTKLTADNIEKFIGNITDKKCPKCGSGVWANQMGSEWCSNPDCDWGLEDVSLEENFESFLFGKKESEPL